MRKITRKTTKFLILNLSALLITACSLFDKDNTPEPKPLTQFTAEISPRLIWTARAGSGVNDEYLRMGPSVGPRAIYTTSLSGTVTALNKANGHLFWQTETNVPVTTSPGIGDGLVVVGSRKGDVIALQESDGRIRWKTTINGEVMAKPAIKDGYIVIKAVDGYTRALSTRDGHELWVFQQVEPSMILRGASSPIISNRSAIVGYANGNLAKLGLNSGQLHWMQTVAIPEGIFPIQRMIDIDADPIVYGQHIYAATYQGKIAALGWESGSIRWSQDISSYTGMIADSNAVYVSDAKSHLWRFNAANGAVGWRQEKLEARVITGPATMGNYVVVGDAQGFLHWLSKQDGHFVGRQFAGSAIFAAPIVENDVLYAITNKGYVLAYQL